MCTCLPNHITKQINVFYLENNILKLASHLLPLCCLPYTQVNWKFLMIFFQLCFFELVAEKPRLFTVIHLSITLKPPVASSYFPLWEYFLLSSVLGIASQYEKLGKCRCMMEDCTVKDRILKYMQTHTKVALL